MMLLELDNLCVTYTVDDNGEAGLKAVDGVSLQIDRGESFGLVGESGCGKSTIAESIMRILPSNGAIESGGILFQEDDLATKSDEEMRRIRWDDISIISQSAMNAFDPVYTVGQQMRETVRAHRDSVTTQEMNERIRELFDMVGIDEDRIEDYPHQFSGGMKQRAMIALAMILEPDLIIADEPTTALDVVNQDNILHHLETLQDQTGAALLIITHDMSVVADLCDRTGIMYGGRLVEIGPTGTVFSEPVHPYTMGLRNAFPTLHDDGRELISIPGTPPGLIRAGNECRFADRCPFAAEECRTRRPAMQSHGGSTAACLRVDELGADAMRSKARQKETWQQTTTMGDTE